MKQTLIITLILALLGPMTAWSASVDQSSQDPSSIVETSYLGENIGLTASLKLWHTTIEFADGDKTSSFIYGPSMNVTFKRKFYAGMNFYTGSGFDYGTEDVVWNEDYLITDIEGEVTKTDYDLWVGYFFHPRGSVFLGYKYSKLEDEENGQFQYTDIYANSKMDITLKGPVIGINGNYPIGDSSFILFGTLGYGFLEGEVDASMKIYNSVDSENVPIKGSKTDFTGFSLEFGASYFFKTIPQFSLTGGYKYQDYTDEEDDSITFSGFTFGANYRF